MINIVKTMISKAKAVLPYAYAPYSHYQVAACIACHDDSFYTGVNIENASYGLSICAESTAICQMITAGKQTIKSIVVLNGANTFCPPCGACRQRIIEFSTMETLIHLCDQQNIIKSLTMDELLPFAFKLKP